MMFARVIVSIVAIIVFCSDDAAAASTTNVFWYSAAGDSDQIADARPAATGFYACCNRIELDANYTVTSVGASALTSYVAAAGGMPVVHTVSVDEHMLWGTASTSGSGPTPSTAADAIAGLVVASNARGAMIDYEVPAAIFKTWSATKVRAVANGYASWATLLAEKLHALNATLGLDLAGDDGGSPIDLFDVFAQNASAVDDLFLMSTYRDLHDSLAYEKVLVTRALAAGIAPAKLGVGLGSVSAAFPTEFGWNASDLTAYLQWLAEKDIKSIGIWRSDIDVHAPSVARTAPFFLDALRAFLGRRDDNITALQAKLDAALGGRATD